jgi:hypothetical protein
MSPHMSPDSEQFLARLNAAVDGYGAKAQSFLRSVAHSFAIIY